MLLKKRVIHNIHKHNSSVATLSVDSVKGGIFGENGGGRQIPPLINKSFTKSLFKDSFFVDDVQLTIDKFDFSDFDNFTRFVLSKFPDKFHTAIKNLIKCGNLSKKYCCENCNVEKVVPYNCQCRYCKKEKDVNLKIMKAKSLLKSYNIKQKRLYHFSVGSNRLLRKQQGKLMSKVWLIMKNKFGYNFGYHKVFDISNTNFYKTSLLWNHLHFALLFVGKFDFRRFILCMKLAIASVNSNLLFNNIGWRSKKSLYSYFAKRNAGQYGHKKTGYYYMEDVMNVEDYLTEHHRGKFLTSYFPVGLINKMVLCYSGLVCDLCGFGLEFVGFVRSDGLFDGFKPPPCFVGLF